MSITATIEKYGARLTIPQLTLDKASIRSYMLNEKAGMEEGGLEYEITLESKPKDNVITIPFSKENITLLYQPPLTEEFKQENCEVWTPTHIKLKNGMEFDRPENVVGSYAVYHSSKRDNQYKTGKICHIFRPKLIDADGKTAWAEFNRDANETSVLTITLPQAFLDSARYPVTVDPTFGKTNIGGTTWAGWDGYQGATLAACPEAGTVVTLHLYAQDAGNARIALYSHDSGNNRPDTLQCQSATESCGATAWHEFDVPDTAVVAATYWLAWGYMGDTTSLRYDSTGSAGYKEFAGSFPSPYGAFEWTGSRTISIYATYTAAGGGGQQLFTLINQEDY